MIKGRNFSDVHFIADPDDCYENCNFRQAAPADANGVKSGIMLFPANCRSRLRGCNLINVQPPPAAVIEDCLLILKEFNAVIERYEVNVDGTTIVVERRADVVYARWDAAGGEWLHYDEPVIGSDI